MQTVSVYDQLASVALVARRCPSTTLRRAYVTAMRAWCAQTQWLRVNIPGAAVAGTKVYSLGSDTYTEIVGIYAMSGTDTSGSTDETFSIRKSDSSEWNPNLSTGRPLQYAYIPEGQFALHQTPDKVYSLTVTAIVQPKDDVAQVPSEPIKKYGDTFEAGALAYLLMLPGQPWTNMKEADKQDRVFRAGISNGKAEAQRQYNTGSNRVRPRAFVMGR